MPEFNIRAYYQNLARTFRGGPTVPHRVANKTAGPGEFVGSPIGTAAAYLRDSTNTFASHMAHYGNYSRLSRYADYSEMETMAEVASALDIYSHEVCAKGEYGEILKIDSNNPEIKNALIKLFYDTLNIEFNLAPWVRSLCKYGDYMLLVDHHPDYGVVNVFPMPVNEVEREEGFDPENPMRYRYRWITHANKVIEPWQVIHFRLLGNDSYLPYGMSILEAGRRAWRQLILMEDAVMVYRIVRSPERRVFYIDVGNVAPENVGQVMEKTRNNMKRNQVVDPNTGQVDLRYNALSVDEDYFIGVRGQDSGTKIDTLPGGNYTGDIEDLHYIQNKLFAALKIPKSYLGYEGDISGKCLHPDTKIALLDNSSDSIKNIAKRFEQGEELFTYTIGPDGAMACGKVLGAAKTRRNAQLVEVTLDNGERIKCTPDHLFMLRDGTYRQAKDLEPQQSLMPLYREMSTKEQDKLDGYEKVYDPGSQEFLFTHRMVADSRGIRQKGKVVHHADFCKLNNHPANLDCSMSFFEHIEYHREHANKCINSPEAIARRTSDPKWLKSASDAGKIGCLSLAAWRAKGGTHAIWNKGLTAPDDPRIARYVEHQTKHNQIVKCDNPACDVKFRRSLSINTKNGFRRFCSVPCMAEGNRIHQTEYRRKNHSKYWVEKICLHCEERFEARRVKAGKFCSILCRRSYGKYKNPRYKDRADVPSLLNHKVVSVRHLDKREDCYDLQIDTAPNFALEAGVFVHNSTLAQEDVRFARTIQHIQRVVIAELEKIAMIHLYSMGLRDEDITDFELSMANPSTINEIQRLELWRTRFEVASLASQEGVLDRTFFYRHIFKLSDQEIEAIEAGRIRDKQLQVELDSMQLRAEQEIEMGGQGAEADSIEEPPPDDGDLDDDEQTDGPMGTGSIDQVGEGSDPNRQRAAPNDMLGRAKKKKKKRDDPRKHVYNTKKNGMDPLKDLQLMRRAGTSPWAEQNERDQSDAIHEKRIGLLGRYSQLIQSLENFKIGQKKKKLL